MSDAPVLRRLYILCIDVVTSIGQVLLGVLVTGPAHGDDLKRGYDARFPGAKPFAYGQVYATLAKPERDGLVEVAETVQVGGPERTIYALTATGTDWVCPAFG